MKRSIFALVLAAGLSGNALAQGSSAGTEHGVHHPQAAQGQIMAPVPGDTPVQSVQMRMPGAQGGNTTPGTPRPGGMMSGMAQGTMSCPMMQGGMAGMRQGAMQMSQPRGDQSVGSLAMNAVNERMHREMATEYTGNVDADFTRNMIAHHQGAIDMAKVVAAFGKDPKIRELAQNIIKAQEDEITMMKSWLAENARQ